MTPLDKHELSTCKLYRVSGAVHCVPVLGQSALGHGIILKWNRRADGKPHPSRGLTLDSEEFEIVGFEPGFEPRGHRYRLCEIYHRHLFLEAIDNR